MQDIGQETWSYLSSRLQNEYGGHVFNTWFSNLKFKGIRNSKLVLAAPTKFIREWILTHYLTNIRQFASQQYPELDVDIEIAENDAATTVIADARPMNDNTFAAQSKPLAPSNESSSASELSSHLDSKMCFENFIVGPSNQIAYGFARSLLEPNPISKVLYINGSVGLGKTHLLQSIATAYRQKKDKKVAYMSAEKFMHLYVAAVRNSSLIDLRSKMRELDILLLDDLQFICGKQGTEQEFSNTLNAFIEYDKIIVLSGDRSIYDMPLDERTKSRLAAGAIAPVSPPEYQLRLSILESIAARLDVQVPHSILNFIATNIISSVRSIEAALYKIVTHSKLMGLPITQDAAENILKDTLIADGCNIDISKIIDITAASYGISTKELLSKSRSAKHAFPRQVAIYLASKLTKLSYKKIGQEVGRRDHATVIYTVKKVEKDIREDPSLAQEIDKIATHVNDTTAPYLG